MATVFQVLGSIDCSKYVESKNGFSYLSWAWAWGEVQKHYVATRKVYKDINGNNYHTDGKTCWVEVGVTIEGIEQIDMLPVMNFRNQSIPVDAVTSFDVNKTIQRATVKALALHGLGLNIYMGEDLPVVDINYLRKRVADQLLIRKELGATDFEIRGSIEKHLGVKELKDCHDIKALEAYITYNEHEKLKEEK